MIGLTGRWNNGEESGNWPLAKVKFWKLRDDNKTAKCEPRRQQYQMNIATTIQLR
jgi:hypothetical protein